MYALGVGAAHDPLDDKELRTVYDLHGAGFVALPTFAVAPALGAIFTLAKQGVNAPGLKFGLDRVLHGEQYTELTRPLPTHAKVTHRARVKDIFDKGKNALVITEIKTTDESGEVLAINELTTFVRGAGGWGGGAGSGRGGWRRAAERGRVLGDSLVRGQVPGARRADRHRVPVQADGPGERLGGRPEERRG